MKTPDAAISDGHVGTIYERMVEQVDQLAEDRIARNAEIKRLREVLRKIEHWPFDVGHSPERDLREIKELAHDALAD